MKNNKFGKTARAVFAIFFALCVVFVVRASGKAQYTGKFDKVLIADTENTEQIIFKTFDRAKLNIEKPLGQAIESVTAAKLYNASQDRFSILAILVEESGKNPILYADLNEDGFFAENERFTLERTEENNFYDWSVILDLPINGVLYKNFPLYVNYLKNFRSEEMTDSDRLVLQSTEAYARGKVNVGDKEILIQYGYKPGMKKISPENGWLGVDTDGDGKIDMNELSPEAARAENETIVFRVGQKFLSTQTANLEKNLIVMREHPPSDYKRIELRVGAEIPNFTFVDFDGKKRRFSEFRGKFVLLNFWGAWCSACRRELPYIKTAYELFRSRRFEVLGMNTDSQPDLYKPVFKQKGITWTQTRYDSIKPFLKNLRINSFPTTLLIDNTGKIISTGRGSKGQLRLRGAQLLKTLDEVLPESTETKSQAAKFSPNN
jgi:thiol-disulfide isomerase/thioredoxin